MSKFKIGDRIRYIEDHRGMKGKMAYIIYFMDHDEILVESEISALYPGFSRDEMTDYLSNKGPAILTALAFHKDRLGGRFCQMRLNYIELAPEPPKSTRNETYLFPDIKDLK